MNIVYTISLVGGIHSVAIVALIIATITVVAMLAILGFEDDVKIRTMAKSTARKTIDVIIVSIFFIVLTPSREDCKTIYRMSLIEHDMEKHGCITEATQAKIDIIMHQ